MCRGICPPSNPAGTFLRAPVPLVPRPAVLPLDPSPRPTRVLAFLAPAAGRRWCTFKTWGRCATSALGAFFAGAALAVDLGAAADAVSSVEAAAAFAGAFAAGALVAGAFAAGALLAGAFAAGALAAAGFFSAAALG